MHVMPLIGALIMGAISLALLWAILSPNVRDGIVIKAGLIVAMLGSSSLALRLLRDGPEAAGVERSMLLMASGTALIGIGLVWRRTRGSGP